jgi:hypothetical protein
VNGYLDVTDHKIDPRFIQNILWTDESYFSQDGIFNQHNNHIWATENPFAVHPRAHQHRFGINLWAGVIDNNLVGPFTLPARVNAENFLQFLKNDFQVLLEDLPLAILRQIWLQMDGAPPHFGRIVRDWCDETYPNRWIGRGGAIACPPPGHLTLILVTSSSGVTSKILYMLRRLLT